MAGIVKATRRGTADLMATMTPGVHYSAREISGLLGTAESTAWMLLRRAALDGVVRHAGRGEFWIPETQGSSGNAVTNAVRPAVWSTNG